MGNRRLKMMFRGDFNVSITMDKNKLIELKKQSKAFIEKAKCGILEQSYDPVEAMLFAQIYWLYNQEI